MIMRYLSVIHFFEKLYIDHMFSIVNFCLILINSVLIYKLIKSQKNIVEKVMIMDTIDFEEMKELKSYIKYSKEKFDVLEKEVIQSNKEVQIRLNSIDDSLQFIRKELVDEITKLQLEVDKHSSLLKQMLGVR